MKIPEYQVMTYYRHLIIYQEYVSTYSNYLRSVAKLYKLLTTLMLFIKKLKLLCRNVDKCL